MSALKRDSANYISILLGLHSNLKENGITLFIISPSDRGFRDKYYRRKLECMEDSGTVLPTIVVSTKMRMIFTEIVHLVIFTSYPMISITGRERSKQ